MGAPPLAEVFEELKELRRQGGEASSGMQSEVERKVGEAYAHALKAGLNRTAGLLRMALDDFVIRKQDASLIKVLEIKTLADRVFGDDGKAEAWLQRPNSSLSGQRPADLLKDELGAAVVRETLERIDHGIFA